MSTPEQSLEHWAAKQATKIDAAVDERIRRLKTQVNFIFQNCDLSLQTLLGDDPMLRRKDLSESADWIALTEFEQGQTPERYVGLETVDALASITDAALKTRGLNPEHGQPAPVLVIKMVLPTGLSEGYGLKIYALEDGFSGFNTGSSSEDDNSRRWVIYIDRGTNFGAAFDYKCTVYQHGLCQLSNHAPNIRTGPVEHLLEKFQNYEHIRCELFDPDAERISRQAQLD